MQTLQDRHIVVTGGTGALGAAVVLKFYRGGRDLPHPGD